MPVRLAKTLVLVTAVALSFLIPTMVESRWALLAGGMAVVEPIVLVFILTSAFLMIG
ncbi:Uncharacterised protein [Vibrio cholerae]|nr:Uncharacterised protein [Vibrio cholerae]CSC65249.1 Uncharacterised protein [Vibrio cholerae]